GFQAAGGFEIARIWDRRVRTLAVLFLGFPSGTNSDSVAASEGTMRPKKHETTDASDLFRARLDQIINMKHELVQLACKLDWEWLDDEIAPLYSDKGRPGIKTRFVIGLLLLKHIFALSDEEVCGALGLRPVLPVLHRRGVLPAAQGHHLPDRRQEATPSTPSLKPPKGSPGARSSAPMSTRDTAGTIRPIRAASSSPARSAAASASSSANCGAAPPSKL